MPTLRPMALLTLVLIVSGCQSARTSSIPDWSAPTSYAFTLDSSCGERALIGQFRVVVEDGTVTDARGLDESGRAVFDNGLGDEVPTVDELLDEAEAAAEEAADVVDVQATRDGRPTHVEIDWDANATDDEACYRITNFTEDIDDARPDPDVGPGEESARILDATVTGDGTRVELGIGICERPLRRVTVEETPEEVRLHAMTTDDEDLHDCALGTSVRLDEPLGDRTIVDVGNDQALEVHDATE